MDLITRTVKTTGITIKNTTTEKEMKITVNGERKEAIKEAQRYIKRNKLVGLALISKIDDTVEKLLEMPLSIFIEGCRQYENLKDKTELLISITEAEQPTETSK